MADRKFKEAAAAGAETCCPAGRHNRMLFMQQHLLHTCHDDLVCIFFHSFFLSNWPRVSGNSCRNMDTFAQCLHSKCVMDDCKKASALTAALVETNVEGWRGGNHSRGPAVVATHWLASARRCVWIQAHSSFPPQEKSSSSSRTFTWAAFAF